MNTGRTQSAHTEVINELIGKISPGCILYLYCDFIDNPKNKYILVAHIDFQNEESLIFFINSEIPSFILRDAHLKNGQIKLEKETGYPFFDHDSYLNCVEHYDCLDLNYVVKHLLENPDDIKGKLSKKDIKEVIAYVGDAQTITNIDKKTIIKSLSNVM